ncbi:hypothetical protein [Burkholderia sp. BKH01]|uniref:hypothetical protein n=1 Tax=Burkholderia sp. BKH01 TaxID=2769262 RepID=UPI00398BCAAB
MDDAAQAAAFLRPDSRRFTQLQNRYTVAGVEPISAIKRIVQRRLSIPDLRSKAIERRIAAHGFPGFEGMRARLPFFLCVDVVTAVHEKVWRLVVDRCKSLLVAR